MINASSAQRTIGRAALVTGAAFRIGKAQIRKALAIWATATLTLSAAPQQYNSYDYAEPGKQYRLVVPKGLETVRGILVVCNYLGGDSRDYYSQNWYSEFMDLHGFAFVGSKGNNSHAESYQAFLRALKQFSIDSHQPELVNVPYATTGFSAGGGFASTLLTKDPDKVIASVPVGARINFDVFKAPDAPTAAHLGVPTCLITGEQENSANVVDPVFVPYRPQGALYSWMAVQGIGHEMRGQELLAMPVLDAAVRLRYPVDGDVRKGPIKLKSIDVASGWVADNTTWKSGLTTIVPAKQFKGDLGHSSWLLNEDLAFIYRAYSTYDKPLTITSPPSGIGYPGITAATDRIAQTDVRATLTALVNEWRRQPNPLSPRELASALRAANAVDEFHRKRQTLEIVWSGPSCGASSFRRTDQALLDLIQGATSSILVVTFAAYKVPHIATALLAAAKRGVPVALILESAEASDGAVTFNAIDALGSELEAVATVYA